MINGRSLRRFAILLLAPAASALTPLIALPALLNAHGEPAWAAIAIGQSIGVAVATIVELGWGLNGPQLVAKRSKRSQRQLFGLALASRLVATGPLLGAAVAVSLLVVPSHAILAAVSAAGASLAGLTSTWYFIGTGAASQVLVTDSGPRIVFASLATIALQTGAPAIAYPVLVLIVPAISTPLISMWIVRPIFARWSIRRLVNVLLAQRHVIAARAVSASYIALPITFVGLVSPAAVAQFAAIERLQRMALTMLAALPSSMQPWIGRSSREARRSVATRAVLINVVSGLLCGIAAAIVMPFAVDIVFAGKIEIPSVAPWLTGCLIAIVMTSRATGGLLLIALNRHKVVSRSAAVGAGIGVPPILLLARAWGTIGALLAEIIAELSVLTTQLLGSRRTR